MSPILVLALVGFFLLGALVVMAPCILSSWISRWEEAQKEPGHSGD